MLRSIRPNHRRRSSQQPAPPKSMPLSIDKPAGICYVAFGEKAIQSCEVSLKSARKIHPGIKIAVISTQKINGADIQIIKPEKDVGAREYKTQVYQYTPFEYTLYLDADTVVVGTLQAGFSALRAGWDVAAAMDYRQTVGRIDHLPQNDVDAVIKMTGTGEYPHLNTGMLFFRKSPEVEDLYNLWHKEWERFHYRDQGAFVRAVHQSEAKIWVLAWQWNTHRFDHAKHVFHNHHAVDRQWNGSVRPWELAHG